MPIVLIPNQGYTFIIGNFDYFWLHRPIFRLLSLQEFLLKCDSDLEAESMATKQRTNEKILIFYSSSYLPFHKSG